MSDLLLSLVKKSESERIALIALYKRVTRAYRFLTKSDVSDSLVYWEQIALSLFCSQKTSDSLEKKNRCFHNVFERFFTAFSIFKLKSESPPSLFAASHLEKSKPLFRSFALSLTKNERFTWKTKELIPYPTLHKIVFCIELILSLTELNVFTSHRHGQ